MCHTRRYVKFRQGAEWERIRDSLECEGVRPTAPDRERIESGIEMAQHLGKICRDAQVRVLPWHHEHEMIKHTYVYRFWHCLHWHASAPVLLTHLRPTLPPGTAAYTLPPQTEAAVSAGQDSH